MATNAVERPQSGRKHGFEDVPRPFIIGVAGGTASGKSTVCERIMQHLGQHEVEQKQRQVVTVSMDSFYRKLTEEEQTKARKGQFNFDHPNAFDDKFICDVIEKIKSGETVEVPKYDYVEHKEKHNCVQIIYPGDVVVFEGILAFYFKEIRDKFNMKLFVDTDPDTRLSRRVMRDVKELGRDIDQILYQYTSYVKPAFEEFCLPTKKYADVIIPRGADNTVAIELIVQHIQDLLRPSRASLTRRTRTNSDSLLVFNCGEGSLHLQEKYSSAH